MENKQKSRILEEFIDYVKDSIYVLDISDDYEYLDEDLMKILKYKVDVILDKIICEQDINKDKMNEIKIMLPSGNPKILEYFGEYYEEVFISFKPFHKIKIDSKYTIENIYRNLENINSKIRRETIPVKWQEIKEKCEFENYYEISDALMNTSENMCNKWKLKEYLTKNQILIPEEDVFEINHIEKILEYIRAIGYKSVYVNSEYEEEEKSKEMEINDRNIEEIICNIGLNRVYTPDKKILLLNPFDLHETFLCSNKKIIDEIILNTNIEGIFCDKNTRLYWSRKNL